LYSTTQALPPPISHSSPTQEANPSDNKNPFATNICREDSAGIHYYNSSNKKFQLHKNLLVLLLLLLHLCRTQAPFPPHPAQPRDDHIASKYPYRKRLRERKQTF
jgi:hypothetical protein